VSIQQLSRALLKKKKKKKKESKNTCVAIAKAHKNFAKPVAPEVHGGHSEKAREVLGAFRTKTCLMNL